mmetsp:Transcript_65779/g.186764  ORF Transcript_65779/g.186764 Transcript_65779/m.186764 type:complete len:212 (-) Transcript_65779:124-759(-)
MPGKTSRRPAGRPQSTMSFWISRKCGTKRGWTTSSTRKPCSSMCIVSFRPRSAKFDGGMTRHSFPSPTRCTSNWKSSLEAFRAALYALKDMAMSAATSANSPSASPKALGPHAASRATWSLRLPTYFSRRNRSRPSASSSGFSTRGFCSRLCSSSLAISSLLGSVILTVRTAGPPPGPVGVGADTLRLPGPGVSSSPSSSTFSSSSPSRSS